MHDIVIYKDLNPTKGDLSTVGIKGDLGSVRP